MRIITINCVRVFYSDKGIREKNVNWKRELALSPDELKRKL